MPEPLLWGVWGIVAVGLAVAILEDKEGRWTNMFVGAIGLAALVLAVVDPISIYLNVYLGIFGVAYGILGFSAVAGEVALALAAVAAVVGGVISGASAITTIGFAVVPVLFIVQSRRP